MLTCCPAWRAWRADISPDDARLVYEIPCDNEKMEKCRKSWQIKEKIDLYNAQSDQALEGDSKLLQHLGRAKLNQGEPMTEDPGIGDLVFVLPPQTPTIAPQSQNKGQGVQVPQEPQKA